MTFANITTVVPTNACETASGQYVDVVTPDPATISVGDIAWSLARQARFAGHTLSEEVWSVAQHSVFVMRLVTTVLSAGGEELRPSLVAWLRARGHQVDGGYFGPLQDDGVRVLLGALLHDATEAYLVDLPSPVKRHQALREPYKALEMGLAKAIDQALKLPPLSTLELELITWADLLALQIEAAHLMPSRGRGWGGDYPAMRLLDMELFPCRILTWRAAYLEFVQEYSRLTELTPYTRLAVHEPWLACGGLTRSER